MGRLKGRVGRLSVLLCALGMALLAGCSNGANGTGYSPIGKCPDGSNPNFDTDPDNCGACDIRCDDLRGEAICRAGICTLRQPVLCAAGFVDADGNPDNGCECLGATARDCRTCLDYEIPMNGIDDDCEPGTLDLGDRPGGADVPASRAHCGAQGASCTLPAGALDVRCQPVTCTASRAATGICGACDGDIVDGNRSCGLCVPVGEVARWETGDECFDGEDQDGSGIKDDGPECEVLLANAVTRDCNLAVPSDRCPPNMVTIPSVGSILPELQVGLTYDLAYDRYEVTRKQFAAFMLETDRCDELLDDGSLPPHCTVEPGTEREPVTEVTWCAAYDYCEWAGKRLPTMAEYYRAAGSEPRAGLAEGDAQGRSQMLEQLCISAFAPVLPACSANGVVEVDVEAGVAVVGGPTILNGRPLYQKLYNLTGNVAEWLFDARVDWCATDGVHSIMAFRDLVCPDGREARQRQLFYDFAPSPLDLAGGERAPRQGQQRMMCGGGWASTPGVEAYDRQQPTHPGIRAPHYGFRCARTFHADRETADQWPYERGVPASDRALCEGLPLAGVAARTEPGQALFRAFDVCMPSVDAPQEGLRQQVIEQEAAGIFMSLEASRTTAEKVRLQAGLDAGAELLWLAELDPVTGVNETGCIGQPCALTVQDAKPGEASDQLALPGVDEVVLPSNGLTVRSLRIGDRSICLSGRGTVVRLQVDVDAPLLARLLGLEGPVPPAVLDGLTNRGQCLDPEAGCTRWLTELDLAFTERPVNPG